MTEPATPTTTPAATPAAPPAAPRVKLTLKHGDKEHSLLKYAFPVKAATYPIKVNGVEVKAASTTGRGRSYTYLLINNTSFYVSGILPTAAEVTVNFPEDYKFDETIAKRVSTYKPKKPAKPAEPNGAASGTQTPDPAAPATAAPQAAAEASAPKAARRAK